MKHLHQIFQQNLKQRLPLKNRLKINHHNRGFTLVEILTASLLAGIVLSSLLWLMNSVLRDNQKEIAISQTQQETRMALDYITEDLRQAVYVYDGAGLKRLIDNNYLPFNNDTNRQPILAFWKVETVPYTSNTNLPTNCETSFTGNQDKIDECKALQIERKSYTLVLYLQSTADANNWSGQSRIERFQLRKYSNPVTLTRNNGYVDPIQENTSFQSWPISLDDNTTNLQAASPNAITETLVDFISHNNAANSNLATLPNCVTSDPTYQATPEYNSGNDADYPRGFFTCVHFEKDAQNQPILSNQDVVVFLQGNAEGKNGVFQNSPLSNLSTQVYIRGVINGSSN